jgi:hypothetical protein
MIILPTRGRPESIKRFMEAYVKTEATAQVLLVTDHDDNSYDALELHANFKRKIMPEHNGIGDCFNAVFAEYPDLEYYGVMADDVVPSSPKWDQKLKEACLPFNISWGNDGLQGANLPTHPHIAGDVVRSLGWIACPGVMHWFVDNMWKDIAGVLGGKYLPDVLTPHYHVLSGQAELDDTYMNQPSREKDMIYYMRYKNSVWPDISEKLKQRG